MTSLTLAVLALGLAAAAVPPAPGQDRKDSDLDKLQGMWVLVHFEQNGEKAPDDKVKQADVRVVIEGQKLTARKGEKVYARGSFTLDPSARPPHIDIEETGPDGKARKTVGIYEVKGDTLRLCFVPAGRVRPAAFQSRAGTGEVLETLQRPGKR